MRIAYCTESLPPLVDGVTRTLSELVATLRETGHEFTFLSAVKPDPGLLWRDRVHTVPSVPFPLYPYYRVCLPAARTPEERESTRLHTSDASSSRARPCAENKKKKKKHKHKHHPRL